MASREELEKLADRELMDRLDALRAEELRRLELSAGDPKRARFFQETEKLAALGTLVRGIAHEFNNLFSGVIAHCDYALQTGDEAARTRALEVAVAQVRQASAIVKNLQRFARRRRARRADADPRELIERTLQLLQPSLKQRKVTIAVELDAVPAFRMDPSAIELVLLNLLTNAMQASPTGGEIAVSLRRDGERLCAIAVRDQGPGIPPAQRDRIFTPFFSTKGIYARSEGERRLTGTGLGLSVAYGIVRQHGGRIDVDSAPGEGSVFRVLLPMEGSDGGW